MRHTLIGLVLAGLAMASTAGTAAAQGYGNCPLPGAYYPDCPIPGPVISGCPGPGWPGPAKHYPAYLQDPCWNLDTHCPLESGYPWAAPYPNGGGFPKYPIGPGGPSVYPGSPNNPEPDYVIPPVQTPQPKPGQGSPYAPPGPGNSVPQVPQTDPVPPPPGPVPPSHEVPPAGPGQGYSPSGAYAPVPVPLTSSVYSVPRPGQAGVPAGVATAGWQKGG